MQPAQQGGLTARVSKTFDSLAILEYRYLWFGTLFSMASMQVNIVARSWLAYDMSGSGLVLGLVAIARGLPQIVLSPIGGLAADRLDKRRMLILCQWSLAILAILNALLVQFNVIQIWHLVSIGLVQGIIFPFTQPARQAYIPEIVGKEKLPNALAIDSIGRNLNRILAPSVAGLLLAWHPTIAFWAIALLYIGAAMTLRRLPPHTPTGITHSSTLHEMTAGFSYILSRRKLLVLIAMGFLGSVFGMPLQQILPVFQVDVLHVGTAQLGFMYTAIGAGALIGSLAVAYRSDYPHKGILQVIIGIVFGLVLIPFAQSTDYWLSLGLLVVFGAVSQSYMTLNRMLVLLDTDSMFYGRVIGIYMMTWTLMPIAALPIGALVDGIGAPLTISIAGGLLAVFMVLLTLGAPAVWHESRGRTPD